MAFTAVEDSTDVGYYLFWNPCQNYSFFFFDRDFSYHLINIGVRVSLCEPRLIPRILKLTIMQVASGYYMNNHMARTWDHRENKSFSLKLLLLNHLLDS